MGGERRRAAQLGPAAFGSCHFIRVPKQLWQLLRNLSQLRAGQLLQEPRRSPPHPVSARGWEGQGLLACHRCTEDAPPLVPKSTCFPALTQGIGCQCYELMSYVFRMLKFFVLTLLRKSFVVI